MIGSGVSRSWGKGCRLGQIKKRQKLSRINDGPREQARMEGLPMVFRCYLSMTKAVAAFAISLLVIVSLQPSAFAAPEVTSAIIEVAKKNIPAVAHVEVTERRSVPNPLLPFQKDPLFRQFFGNG